MRVLEADVGDFEALAQALGKLPRLRGVFHLAMTLEDARLADTTAESYARVLSPKLFGAWHLHRLTKDRPLDHFVLFSSLVGELGNPGQAAYAAANAFLDSLAEWRRAHGMPALSVAWGALAGAGVLARQARVAQHLERQGWRGIPVRRALDILGDLMTRRDPVIAVADIDWNAWRRAFPSITRRELLRELVGETGSSQAAGDRAAGWRETLAGTADPIERQARAEKAVTEVLGRVLRLPPEKIATHRRLDQMGVDSLMAVELQHVLHTHSGVELSAMDLMRGPTVAQLATLILGRMGIQEAN